MKREYTIELTTEMLGTVTKDPEVYRTYIESKKPEGITEEEYLTVDKIEEKGWTGFHRDENGLFVYDYFIKGFVKHAGNILKDIVKVKALRSKLDDYLFIFPRHIYLGKQAPDGFIERPIRVMTMQGPRVSLIRSDYVKAGTQLVFTMQLVPHKEISWTLIDTLMSHGELMGLGQFRNGGYGRFKVVEYKEVKGAA